MNRRAMLSTFALAATSGISSLPTLALAAEAVGTQTDPNVIAGTPSPFRTAIELPTLKYDPAALAPVISATTVGFHHGKHHVGYYNNLKGLLSPADLASLSLEDVILRNAPERHNGVASGLFNNAAQVWNHNFYWNSLRANGGGKPGAAVAKAIDASFGSFEAFKEKFTAASVAQFGSGWSWLVRDRRSGRLSIITTGNAATPLTDPQLVPLLVVDVWEHAYYLDYQNKRVDYVKAVFDKLLNWGFAEANLSL
jgi:Fe-Mn family superoxide dismutase